MNTFFRTHLPLKKLIISAICINLSACGDLWNKDKEPEMKAEQIAKVIPTRVHNRQSWAEDIFQIMQQLSIPQTRQNVCSIVAIVDQESNFVANPVVPNLGRTAVQEVSNQLQEKFEEKLGKAIGGTVAQYFENVLKNQPTPENSYLKQMRQVKTEEDLDDLYREIFHYMSKHYHVSAVTGIAKLIGEDIGEKMNPINTLGSMQVHINYAKEHKRQSGNITALRDDLYSQYGGLYYGIHRLMSYPAQYDQALYRFADYNSGMYSSRNAAFQKMLAKIQNQKLDLDGDLLLYNKDGRPLPTLSQTEKEIIAAFTTHNILVTPRQVRKDLKKEKQQDFEETQTYLAIQELYQNKTQQKPLYAVMPEVKISGPKLSRDYNTNWYASRVNGRYETCMRRAKRIKL